MKPQDLREEIAKLRALVRTSAPIAVRDPAEFATALGYKPDPWQEQLLRAEKRQVVVLCSRQVGKSQTVAIKALHRAVYFPRSLVLVVAPSDRQSGELFRRIADLAHRLGDVLAPVPELVEDNKRSLELANGSRIVALPDAPATIRSFAGVALLVIDEAAFVSADLLAAVRPMLATVRGQLIMLSTPWGKSGAFYEAWANGGEGWERISIKATECPRIPPEFLAEERTNLGEMRFRAEYLCEFLESTSSFFSAADVAGAVSDEVQPLFPVPGSPQALRASRGPNWADATVTEEVKPLFGEVP